jgi:hypothetical protein
MAKQFSAEGVPTLSGKGAWDGKTLARLCRESKSPL